MKADVLLGLQWGDEGKGKIVDVLTPDYDIVARFQGGPNAGHTLEFNNEKYVLHTVPSGIFQGEKKNVIGNGVVIDPNILKQEIEQLEESGKEIRSKLVVSRKAHIILPTHRLLDAAYEQAKGKAKIGSTLKGIGPTYTDKISRNGMRVGDLFEDFDAKYAKLKERHIKILEQHDFDYKATLEEYESSWMEGADLIRSLKVEDTEYFVNNEMLKGQTVLAEGAQGTMLDIDFGSYPFVTSSNTICAGACTGLGVAPKAIGDVFGIFKAYCTRVGSGPFPTELFDETGEEMRSIGHEFGATTGRSRRCGWIDLVALRYSVMINGVTKLIMMKSDVLDTFETIKVGVAYNISGTLTDQLPFEMNEELEPVLEDLPGWKVDMTQVKSEDEFPKEYKEYIKYLEDYLGVPIAIVSVGPDREQTIFRNK